MGCGSGEGGSGERLSLPTERSVHRPQAALGRAEAQGPGVGQDGGPENSEQASPRSASSLLCPEPSMTQALCWRPQAQACKQMRGPWVLAAWTL